MILKFFKLIRWRCKTFLIFKLIFLRKITLHFTVKHILETLLALRNWILNVLLIFGGNSILEKKQNILFFSEGYQGAILQSYAVSLALQGTESNKVFVAKLKDLVGGFGENRENCRWGKQKVEQLCGKTWSFPLFFQGDQGGRAETLAHVQGGGGNDGAEATGQGQEVGNKYLLAWVFFYYLQNVLVSPLLARRSTSATTLPPCTASPPPSTAPSGRGTSGTRTGSGSLKGKGRLFSVGLVFYLVEIGIFFKKTF